LLWAFRPYLRRLLDRFLVAMVEAREAETMPRLDVLDVIADPAGLRSRRANLRERDEFACPYYRLKYVFMMRRRKRPSSKATDQDPASRVLGADPDLRRLSKRIQRQQTRLRHELSPEGWQAYLELEQLMDRRYFELLEKLRAEQTSEPPTGAMDRSLRPRRAGRPVKTSAPIRGEWRLIWPDGSVQWLVARFQIFR
jgi:hypothetical protein